MLKNQLQKKQKSKYLGLFQALEYGRGQPIYISSLLIFKFL
jgi:hypothetical protein